MKKLFKTLCLLLAVAMLLCLCACGGTDDTSDSSAPAENASAAKSDASGGKTDTPGDAAPSAEGGAKILDELNVGNYGSTVFIGCFDVSGYFNTSACQGAKYLVYDQLFYINNDQPESRILSDYYYEDETTLVMQLRDDIYFSNGDQMTPEDVMYSLKLYQNGCWARNVNTVDLESSYYEGNTIYLKYKTPDARGPVQLIVSIMNKDFVEGLVESVGGDEFSIDWYMLDTQCGSGPYICTESATDSYAVYKLRDDYWGMEDFGAPAKTINCYYYSDQTTMVIEFEQGKLNVAYNVSASDAARIINGEVTNGSMAYTYGNINVGYTFSDETDYFSDVNSRLAFAHSLDIAALTEMAYGLYGKVATGIFAEAMPWYIEGLTYSYDPDLARECLAAAGKESIDFTLTCMSVAQFSALAEITQYYAGQVGINMQLDILEPIAAIDKNMQGNYAMGMSTGSPDGGVYDPNGVFDSFRTSMTPDGNYSNTDPEFCAMIEKGLINVDTDVRKECYEWLQHYAYDNCYIVPVCDSSSGLVYDNTMFEEPFTPGISGPDVLLLTLK